MGKIYNILWIDDEWKKQDAFSDECRLQHNIHLEGYSTVKEGLIALEARLESWDGVLLDAEVCIEDEEQTPTVEGLSLCLTKLASLEHKKKLPHFVSSGKESVKNNELLKKMFGNFYIKGDHDDILVRDMKREADVLWTTQLKHKYSDIFEFCPMTDELIRICNVVENGETRNSSIYNDIRKVLAWALVDYCGKHGIAQNIDNDDDIAVSLSKAKGFICSLQFPNEVPPYIQKCIYACEFCCQNGSHSEAEGGNVDKNLLLVDKHTTEGKVPYLIRACFYELLTILNWCKTLPTRTETIEALKLKLKYKTKGIVEKDEKGNFHCGGQCVLDWNIAKSLEGKTIGVLEMGSNKNDRTSDRYKWFSNRFELIEE